MKDVPKAIEAVWKIESTRLIAAIARVTHDIGIAEELAQDALVTALELDPENRGTLADLNEAAAAVDAFACG
jgi:RNA polymerase sigma-70 factor (ECF subfamily)